MQALRIATRKSPLALWQTEHVADRLRAAHPGLAVELVPLSTRGDEVLDRSLAAIGGKGLFLKELEVAMQRGEADCAVHSLKDVPMELGPANRTVYTMTVKDRTLAVEAMAVEHDGGTATITASAATARAAKALMDDIVDTLEPVAASASASSSSAASSASSRAA